LADTTQLQSTALAVRGGSTRADYLRAVAVDGAGGMVAAGSFDTSPATFGGVALTNGGGVVWKVDAEGSTLWAVSGGSAIYSVAVDGAGAVVAAGHFGTAATFGGMALTAASGNYDEVFLWKMSGQGTTLWAVRGGGTGTDRLYGVAVDGSSAVVAVGYFVAGSYRYGYFYDSPSTFGGVALTSGKGSEAVVWKMSAEGTTLWVVSGGGTSSIGGSSSDRLNGVAVDGLNAVVAVGYFGSTTATFGGVTLDNTGSSRISRNADAVLWKLSAEGTTLWAVRSSGWSDSVLNGVAVDGTNAVVAAGYFESSATFGGVALDSSAFSSDAVLWKLSGEGTTLWAVRGGGEGSDDLYGVAVDGAGAVVAAGYSWSSPAMFGDMELSTVGRNEIVWKLSGEGTTLGVVSEGGDDILYGVAVDGAGSVVAAGYFGTEATFGGVALTTVGSYDAVLWKVRAFIKTLHFCFVRGSCFPPIGAYFKRHQFVHVPSICIPRSTG